jgi:hypothetical protein
MPSTKNFIWTSFVIVGASLTGWMGMTMVLHEPLRWAHEANGTFPALQAPIDALTTLAVTALFAVVVYRGLARRRAVNMQREAEAAAIHHPSVGASPTAAGLATTR